MQRRRARSVWAVAGATVQWLVCAVAAGVAVSGLVLTGLFASLVEEHGRSSDGLDDIRRAAVFLLGAAIVAAASSVLSLAVVPRSWAGAAAAQVIPLAGGVYLTVQGWFGVVSVAGLLVVSGGLAVLAGLPVRRRSGARDQPVPGPVG